MNKEQYEKHKEFFSFILSLVFLFCSDIYFFCALHINLDNMLVFCEGFVMAIYNVMSIELIFGKYKKDN